MRKQGKIEKDQVWVQAALDMEDIELAKRVAFLALDNGAERWGHLCYTGMDFQPSALSVRP